MEIDMHIKWLPRIITAHNDSTVYFVLTLSIVLALTPVRTHGDERSGKEVVDTICAECHATGLNGAPMIGDKEAWSSRASQGLSSLTLHAINGIRNMPAHGGDPELSDLEIARSVTYMVNQSGGNWIEPTSAKDLATERSGELVVNTQCAKCHAESVGGAPKIGDLQAWIQRMKKGLPYLVSSAIHGHGGMPPRGGMADLTDSELRSAILYMYNPSAFTTKPSAIPAKPSLKKSTDANHQTVGGIDIYLGFMPAENIRALPQDAPERTMHGGIPKGSSYYHVNVSLFDEKSRAPIEDAQVHMQFDWPGMTSAPIQLEPMLIGGSYGNYVKPQSGTSYSIILSIIRPETSHPVEAKFAHRFLK